MGFVANSEDRVYKNKLVNELLADLKAARTNEEWRHDYMTITEYGRDCREEGREKGREEEIYSSVKDGDYSSKRGAEKLGVSEEIFLERMDRAGYKVTENA